MKDSQVSNNKGIAKWLDDFVNTMSKNKKEVVATINLNDLPQVVWKDETFYVQFVPEKHQAKILNGFTNEVTTLDNVDTIEDVDKILNSNEVVKTSDVNAFENELNKVAELEKEEGEFDSQPDVSDSTDAEQISNTAEEITDPIADIENDIEETTGMLNDFNEVNNKVAGLEEKIATLMKQVEALSEQQYARQTVVDPTSYDMGVEQLEQQHFEETGKASEEAINAEHNIDLTTPAGRISFKDRLLNDISKMNDDQTNIYEQEMSYELGEKSPEDFKDPVFKEYIEDGEKKNDETAPVEFDNNGDKVRIDNIEFAKPEETTEVVVNVPEVKDETETKTDVKPEEKDEDEKVVKLNSKDAKIFKKAICPSCGETGLTKVKTANTMVGVYCKDCNAEYAVNTENEDIFHKISE